MKINFFAFCALLLLSRSLNAQDYHLGLRVGFSSAILNTENEADPALKSRDAFQFAFVHSFRPKQSKYGFSFETGYLLKGARVDDADINYRLHFLSMPVLMEYYPTQRLKIGIGPEINYLVSGRNQVNDSTNVSLHNIYTNRWELSGVVSGSYALSYYADLGVRYSRGFNTLANADAILNRRRIRTSSFQLFLYLKIAN